MPRKEMKNCIPSIEVADKEAMEVLSKYQEVYFIQEPKHKSACLQ
jgi:hypothetical protein